MSIENIEINEYPEVSKAWIVLFCAYVFVWYLQLGSRWSTLDAIRFEFVLAIVLIFGLIVLPENQRNRNPLLPYIVAYFSVLVFQILISQNFEVSWRIFVDRIVKFAFMGVFISAYVRSPRHLLYFIGIFMLACMKMGQEGVYGQITGHSVWENQGVMRLHGSTRLYAHPNSFSGMALGTLPFLYSFWPIMNKTIKILILIQLVFALNIILFTASRTGYVGFIMLIFFIWLKSKSKLKSLLIIFLLIAISLPSVPLDYRNRFISIFTLQEEEGNSSGARIQILKDAVVVFKKYPYGVGVGAFPAVRMELFGRRQDTHNLYLEVLTNLGIHGFLIFFLLIYKTLRILNLMQRRLLRQIRLFEDKFIVKKFTDELLGKHLFDLKVMYAATQAVYLFILVRLSLGMFGMDLYEIYWWFTIGLTSALYHMHAVAQLRTDYLTSLSYNPKDK